MVSEQLKLYWRSKFNLIIMFLSILGILPGLWRDYSEKQEFVQALGRAATDSDIEYLTMMKESFTGLYSFERLFFLNIAFFMLFWMILMIGMGLNIGGQTYSALQSGYGNFIMTRMNYKDYIKKTLMAQIIYLFTFCCLLFLIVFAVMLLWGGGGFQVPYVSSLREAGQEYGPVTDISIGRYLFTLLGLVLYSVLCMIPLALISSLSFVFLKNKYIIQFLPVLILMGGYILGFQLGNINQTMSDIMRHFMFGHALTNLTALSSPNIVPVGGSSMGAVVYVIFYPLLLIAVSFILYRKNVRRFGENYLL